LRKFAEVRRELADRFHPINGFQYLYTKAVLDIYEGCLRLIVEEAGASESQVTTLPGGITGNLIRSTDSSALVSIGWDQYVSYNVTDETYAPVDRNDDEYLDEGRWMRSYSNSEFLRHVEKITFPSAVGEEKLSHFRVRTLNHVIDIVSKDEPVIRVLERSDNVLESVLRTFPNQTVMQ